MAGALDTNPPSTISRALAMVFSPRSEWERAATEDTASGDIFRRYVLPLALVGPVAGVIGYLAFGYEALGATYRPSLVSAVLGAAVAFVLGLVSFLLLTILANMLSPRFGGTMNTTRSYALVAYGATPVWLVGVFQLVPMLGVLGILALYSIYVTYLGVTPMLNVPREKAGTFTLVFVVCAIVMNLLVAALSAGNMALLAGMGLLG